MEKAQRATGCCGEDRRQGTGEKLCPCRAAGKDQGRGGNSMSCAGGPDGPREKGHQNLLEEWLWRTRTGGKKDIPRFLGREEECH